eukprot:COSAG06_NODE_5658_length_3337_cov_67.389438_1_plen_76_part_10
MSALYGCITQQVDRGPRGPTLYTVASVRGICIPRRAASRPRSQVMSGTKARTEDTTENTVLQDTTHSRSAFGHQGL